MIPLRPLSQSVQVVFVGFASVAVAALQNVTVDDAVLTGAVIPQYLPSHSDWNIGNTCKTCFVQLDPSLVYNGTWHDTTYHPSASYTQEIDFTFTGSALYIFFVIANSVPGADTLTDVEFLLDQVLVHMYTHSPTASTNYQYNVSVYSNDSLPLGQHNMLIRPVNTGNPVLILFDYLIYTTDTSSSVVPSASTTLLPSGSAAAPASSSVIIALPPSATSSAPNIGAIVGGTVGGVTAFILVTAFLWGYCRHKKHDEGRPTSATVDGFIPREMMPTPLVGTVSSTPLSTPSITEPTTRRKSGPSPAILRPSNPTPSTPTSSSYGAAPSTNNSVLVDQVEQLRDEVARLRHQQGSSRNIIELLEEAPPEYS